MNINNIVKVELEITTACNAACPGCARTQNLDILKIHSITLEDIQRLFPSENYIRNKKFKFCGVLGDPALNIECLDIAEYLTSYGGYCQLSTNGAYQRSEWWYRFGELSAKTEKVDINFCVDGHAETNHIYRVNTNWKVLDRNMQAYFEGGNGNARATWVYIVFDHNEHEVDSARKHAERLNFKFATRTGMRNSYHDWVALIKKKNKQENKVVSEKKKITTTGEKQHSKVKEIRQLDRFIENYKKSPSLPEIQKQKSKILPTIQCKFIHEGEIYIGADLTLWPCCFLYDNNFKNKENTVEKLSKYNSGWNSLRDKSIEEVLQHPWFSEILEQSWDPDHNMHLSRCIRTCAYNKAYHNEIKFEDKKNVDK